MTLHSLGATTPGATTTSTPTTPHLRSVADPVADPADDFDARLARIVARRKQFQDRHAQRLTALMAQRDDLRGVHALADLVDDAIRWTA
ncbi:hypothetical protein [Nocardioides nanhaiensis]|uniref:Uncharacterized protein n=1 Tax=Nocardioides nanhaiensis TaxID=1476871 RepID=A0ABP8WB21_9ACTN